MPESLLPAIETVPSLPTEKRAAILDALFEPSQPLHNLSLDRLHTQTFSSYDDLIAAIGVQLTALLESTSTSDSEWLDDILGAHPRLGAPKVDSAQSSAEQAQLQVGAADELEQLRASNGQYEAAFPGLRYVVFVDGRSRPVIMADMKKRIVENNPKAERNRAIKAMCDIAADRAQ